MTRIIKANSNFEIRNSKFQIAYLGLGSNLGDCRAHLAAALAEIARQAPLRKVSSFYESEPVGFAEQPDFVNAVAAIAWEGTARSLLTLVQEIERRVGRTPTFRDGPREIDVDILDLGGLVRLRPDPVLPHPRLSSRRFVLEPLAEIAPEWAHPVSGRTVRELLEALPERPSVKRIGRAQA